MARRVFFSFEYENDVWRANIVRNSWVAVGREAAGFVDAAEFEKIKRRGDSAIRAWIDDQLHGTSVSVVLVGRYTCQSHWVRYEIIRSEARGNGLLGIDISGLRDKDGYTTTCCDEIPKGYPFYRWHPSISPHQIGSWIEAAAKAAGR